MKHKLPELPYDMDALQPHISMETLEFHYGKHHNAYVTNLNNLIPGTEFEDMSLEDMFGNMGLDDMSLDDIPEEEIEFMKSMFPQMDMDMSKITRRDF